MSDAGWGVLLRPAARKDLRRLDPPIRRRVIGELEQLGAQGAKHGGLARLKGRSGQRLRVGDWRVILELDHPTRTILVKRVLPRGRAYQR